MELPRIELIGFYMVFAVVHWGLGIRVYQSSCCGFGVSWGMGYNGK